jgi:hypothetical protein
MTLVTAERLNSLFNRMNLILQNGSGQFGYGQGQGPGYGPEMLSYPVSNLPGSNMPNVVSATDINSIYADMLRCRIHQVGTEPSEIAEMVANLNVIAENTSFFVDNQGNQTTDPDGTKKGIQDFEQLMTKIENDRFLAHPSQMSLTNGITAVRTAQWNNIITHEFTVSFENANHRRHFFNSGGEIRFSSSNSNIPSGPSFLKSQDWNNMLVGMGSIIFDHQQTRSSTNSGTQNNIGNYQLTNSYALLYRKVRSTGLVVYSGNQYTIEGKQLTNSSQIQFRVRFSDIANESNIDRNVTGRLESNIRIFKANSPVSITVPAPSFNNNIILQ